MAEPPCTNPDCPIGCPDSHCINYEPPGFNCGTFTNNEPLRPVSFWRMPRFRLRRALRKALHRVDVFLNGTKRGWP